MAEKLMLEVVTPQKAVVSEEVQSVVAPGSEGEFGVLKNHTTFLTSLNAGALKYIDSKGATRYLFVNGGFAEVLPDKVTILAESAERRRDIDLDRAEKAKQRAEKRLADKSAKVDIIRAEAALRRAIYRINIKKSLK
ncbi:MAG: F0F1 ATP synthase subunit epsilon [Proteobacteria bacterium]|nr:F0F1 ATP synthase subunit epsilon [Pseudomonadota bacterium]MBU1387641.1 F0F1 ATP synthase subunit epsilon [Pseudomonadota bacterium]MBU1544232.1 F0F1 ATP synthase subunit epsilon [Pseudomonadota bacterium]